MEQLDPEVFGPVNTCFGCGPRNPIGLKLAFYRDGDEVITRFTPRQGQEGPPGIFHGGLQATIADDLAGWTLVGLRERMGFTQSMQVRYLRPLRHGEEIVGRGKIIKEADRMYVIDCRLEQNGLLGFTARVVYAVPEEPNVEKILGRPIPEEWKRFCR